MRNAPVRLLVSSGADQGVHLGDVDVVQLLNSRLDLMLVGLDVADEDKCVVIFNLFHGRLGSEGVLDDVISIHLVPLGCGLARILWLPGWPTPKRNKMDAYNIIKHPLTTE